MKGAGGTIAFAIPNLQKVPEVTSARFGVSIPFVFRDEESASFLESCNPVWPLSSLESHLVRSSDDANDSDEASDEAATGQRIRGGSSKKNTVSGGKAAPVQSFTCGVICSISGSVWTLCDGLEGSFVRFVPPEGLAYQARLADVVVLRGPHLKKIQNTPTSSSFLAPLTATQVIPVGCAHRLTKCRSCHRPSLDSSLCPLHQRTALRRATASRMDLAAAPFTSSASEPLSSVAGIRKRRKDEEGGDVAPSPEMVAEGPETLPEPSSLALKGRGLRAVLGLGGLIVEQKKKRVKEVGKRKGGGGTVHPNSAHLNEETVYLLKQKTQSKPLEEEDDDEMINLEED